jgi:hypothetical protein
MTDDEYRQATLARMDEILEQMAALLAEMAQLHAEVMQRAQEQINGGAEP